MFFSGNFTGTGRWKVSAKIQQLLNTLKRPKRRPLPEFYEDDDMELEMAANHRDPNAPKPEGSVMTPALGEQLVVFLFLIFSFHTPYPIPFSDGMYSFPPDDGIKPCFCIFACAVSNLVGVFISS